MNDPDAVTMIAWIAILAVLALLGMWMERALKKRNRRRGLPTPRKDDRSSIEYSKPHMPNGKR